MRVLIDTNVLISAALSVGGGGGERHFRSL